MIPSTVSLGFDMLRALDENAMERAFARTTSGGRRCLTELASAPGDVRTQAIRAWNGTAKGHIAGQRGMCRFAELPDARVVVFALCWEDNRWLVDDVVVVSRDDFDGFGALDEGIPNTF